MHGLLLHTSRTECQRITTAMQAYTRLRYHARPGFGIAPQRRASLPVLIGPLMLPAPRDPRRPCTSSNTSIVHASSNGATLAPPAGGVKIKFTVPFKTQFGERLRIVGSHASLGSWDIDAAPALQWSDGDVWTTTITVPQGTLFEYKIVWQSLNGLVWESIANRSIEATADTSLLQVDCLWDNADAVVSVVQEDMLGDEDEDAAQVAAMQVTAVVDGMPASPMESGEDTLLVKKMFNGYKNGSSVNEVYATIALDALESADTLTTLDDVNNAVESLTAGSLQQQVNTTVSGASSPSLPYSSSSSSLSVHSEETQPVTNGAAGALESTTGAVAAATMTANPTTGVSNGVSIGVFGGVSSEYGEYEQQVAEEYADEVAGENAQDGAVNGVVAQAALALETEARAAAAAITVVEEDIKVVEEKENNIVTATETQQDVVKEEVEAAVEDVVQAKEETEVDGAEEDKQGEDVENEEEPTKKEAVAAAVGAAPGGVLGGLQLPESVAKAGKTIGYVALGLGAAAALGAVAVDTAAVDAALASALMAAVIIGDDSKPRREKEEGKEGAEAEGDEAEGVTVEGEAGTQTPRDREGGRLTSPSATPGLLLAFALFAAADIVKAVAATPSKTPTATDQQPATPATTSKTTSKTSQPAKPKATPNNNSTSPSLLNVRSGKQATQPADETARTAAMLRKPAVAQRTGKDAGKGQSEDQDNILMAWFRMTPASSKTTEASKKTSRPVKARPPKPTPVSNNKYKQNSSDNKGANKAKWWGL